MSPDFYFIIERLEASLHTSSPPAQVNHRQYHCFHHQAEAYAIYDTFGVTWWTNFQLMEVKPTVSQISNNCKWCHLVAKCWWKWSERWMFETLTFFQVFFSWGLPLVFHRLKYTCRSSNSNWHFFTHLHLTFSMSSHTEFTIFRTRNKRPSRRSRIQKTSIKEQRTIIRRQRTWSKRQGTSNWI